MCIKGTMSDVYNGYANVIIIKCKNIKRCCLHRRKELQNNYFLFYDVGSKRNVIPMGYYSLFL